MAHKPVMIEQALEALNVCEGGIYIDGTYGRGGHTAAILGRLGSEGMLFAFDKDPDAAQHARQHYLCDNRFEFIAGSFTQALEEMRSRKMCGHVGGILLDLGISSPQVDDANRGFSFLKDGPLDMRMDPSSGMSAEQWLANANASQITDVLRTFGDVSEARKITNAIIEQRQEKPITSTRQLASLIERIIPRYLSSKHPATKIFQAIRIYINHEIDELTSVLPQTLDILAVQGRLVVIAFHSLEDRIVKRFIRSKARGDEYPSGLAIQASSIKLELKSIGKPITPSQEEINENHRSRSAIMRVAEKL